MINRYIKILTNLYMLKFTKHFYLYNIPVRNHIFSSMENTDNIQIIKTTEKQIKVTVAN